MLKSSWRPIRTPKKNQLFQLFHTDSGRKNIRTENDSVMLFLQAMSRRTLGRLGGWTGAAPVNLGIQLVSEKPMFMFLVVYVDEKYTVYIYYMHHISNILYVHGDVTFLRIWQTVRTVMYIWNIVCMHISLRWHMTYVYIWAACASWIQALG